MPSASVLRGDRWFPAALAIVATVTVVRLVLLRFDATDLFVDEVQYWLWGQTLDWGYYSKPPLIAWVIRAVTWAAGSDGPYWIRAPGAVLHGATALILGAVAARLFGRTAGVATAAGYVTLPMVAVGSLLFSTDTVMLPLLAAALWFWIAGLRGGGMWAAAVAGVFCGLAVMAKYAGFYLPLGLACAALVSPGWRAPVRHWLVFAAGLAVMVSPNVVWNLTHDLTTLSHTADNVGWVREGTSVSLASMAEFIGSQFAVVGPVVAGVFLWRLVRPGGGDAAALAAIAVVPLAVVSVQALLGGANANWAVAGWLPGTVLAMAWMAGHGRWLAASLAVNGVLSLLLVLVVMVPDLRVGDRPLLERYLGRADLSRQILAQAQATGLPVVAARRDVLADLFYTGRDSGIAVYAPPHSGRPAHFYEQMHMLPDGMTGDVLLVTTDPGPCRAGDPMPLQVEGGAYAQAGLAMWRVTAECLNARR